MSDRIIFNGPLVGAEWLKDHLDAPNLVLLDATIPKAGSNTGEGGIDLQIPGARFMDLEKHFSLQDAPFPNTMPGQDAFQKQARQLGVCRDSTIVVYDDHGVYSSARAWWMFRSMGHGHVAVLDGGLPQWIRQGYPAESKIRRIYPEGDFTASYDGRYFQDYRQVLAELRDEKVLVLDARAEERFRGLVAEPRPGLRSGHIPGSVNLPYTALLDREGKFLERTKLQEAFQARGVTGQRLVFSCGSGITACVLALGAVQTGLEDLTVYDGSWTEWGSLQELPVEKG